MLIATILDFSALILLSLLFFNVVTFLHHSSFFNNHNNKYVKNEYSTNEYYFENQAILNELKKAGYRYLITTDGNLSPISNIEDVNRLLKQFEQHFL